MKANIYLTKDFETVEALAVVDILRRAEIEVDLVSITNSLEVVSAQGVVVKADRLLGDNEAADVLILPGGPNTDSYKEVSTLKNILIEQNAASKHIAAICAAPSVLGHFGLLHGKNATCFPGFEKHLLGAKNIDKKARVVKDGNIITARGMGTAIDFALMIVEALKGGNEAIKIAKEIQYED